jgi:hypothetical protein
MAVVILMVSGLAWNWAAAAEEDMCVPMGEITLEPISSDPQRESVSFPHAVHFNYDCRACHHTWDNLSPIVGCTTSGCHDLAQAPRTAEGRLINDPKLQISYFKNAFHESCIGCHKQVKQINKAQEASKLAMGKKLQPAGPTGCIECHPKY